MWGSMKFTSTVSKQSGQRHDLTSEPWLWFWPLAKESYFGLWHTGLLLFTFAWGLITLASEVFQELDLWSLIVTKTLSVGTNVLCTAYTLMMLYLCVKFNGVCNCTFLSNCQDIFGPLTPDCDLDLEFGHINIVWDIPSNYGLQYFFVKFVEICFSRFKVMAETGFDLWSLIVTLTLNIGTQLLYATYCLIILYLFVKF